jgi:hypothetical protein
MRSEVYEKVRERIEAAPRLGDQMTLGKLHCVAGHIAAEFIAQHPDTKYTLHFKHDDGQSADSLVLVHSDGTVDLFGAELPEDIREWGGLNPTDVQRLINANDWQIRGRKRRVLKELTAIHEEYKQFRKEGDG